METSTFQYLLLTARRPHVLQRLLTVLSKRGVEVLDYRVDRDTHDPNVQRLSLNLEGPESAAMQIKVNLQKLVDVIHVVELGQMRSTHEEAHVWTV